MQSNRPKDTRLEIAFRSALHQAGLRFRKNVRPVPGVRCEADVVFPRIRLAVFIDGCWWHSCPLHGQKPKTNVEWWVRKLQTTQERDARNEASLRAAGWSVLRVWEHVPLSEAVQQVTAEVSRLRAVAVDGEARYTDRSGVARQPRSCYGTKVVKRSTTPGSRKGL